MSIESRLYIDNQYVAATAGEFKLLNPFDGKTVAVVGEAGPEDVEAAVDGAAAAQPAWAELSPQKRAACMRKLGELLIKHNDELGYLDAITMGRPAHSNTQGIMSADIWNYFASLAENIHGTSSLSTPGFLNISVRQAFGVTAGIIPWNFPVSMFSFKAAPAVAAGNAIIIKTSEKAPLAVNFVGRLVAEAGFPPGIIQILHGRGSTGQLLSRHMAIRKLSFTGSTRTGRHIMTDAAQSNMKNVTLELGGKSPTIIFPDANILAAAEACAFSIAFNTGQVCIASSRLYVHESIFDPFLAALKKAFTPYRLGDPTAAGTSMGPPADSGQKEVIDQYARIGEEDGTLITPSGYPSAFIDVPAESRLNKEEVFGPVLVVHRFSDEAEAIKLANDSDFGLYAAVFTQDIDRALRVAKQLESGSVGINCNSPTTANDMPFGGWKTSGIGRENGPNGLDAWLEQKAVYIKMN